VGLRTLTYKSINQKNKKNNNNKTSNQNNIDSLVNSYHLAKHETKQKVKLEYLAVYGRASMAAFRQLSMHGQKFDPESLYEPM